MAEKGKNKKSNDAQSDFCDLEQVTLKQQLETKPTIAWPFGCKYDTISCYPKGRRLRKAELLIRRPPRGTGEIIFLLSQYGISSNLGGGVCFLLLCVKNSSSRWWWWFEVARRGRQGTRVRSEFVLREKHLSTRDTQSALSLPTLTEKTAALSLLCTITAVRGHYFSGSSSTFSCSFLLPTTVYRGSEIRGGKWAVFTATSATLISPGHLKGPQQPLTTKLQTHSTYYSCNTKFGRSTFVSNILRSPHKVLPLLGIMYSTQKLPRPWKLFFTNNKKFIGPKMDSKVFIFFSLLVVPYKGLLSVGGSLWFNVFYYKIHFVVCSIRKKHILLSLKKLSPFAWFNFWLLIFFQNLSCNISKTAVRNK